LTGLDKFPSASLLADISEENRIIGTIGFEIEQTTGNSRMGVGVFQPYKPISQSVDESNSKIASSTSTIFIGKTNIYTTTPSSFSEIASLEDNVIKVNTNNSTVSPITINKFPIEEASSHERVLQVASNQIGHLTELPYTIGEIAVSESSTKSNAGNFGRVFNANIIENGSRKIDSNQFNSTSFINPIVFPSLINSITTQPDIRQDNVLKGSFPSIVSSQQIFSSNFSHDHTSLLNTIYSTAQTLWHIVTPIDLNFNITNLPTGQLAEGTITSYNTNGTTKTANDAFEVALLDTNTYNALAGTSIGLTNTDSLLNIQANGTIHKSDKVTITTLGNNSSIVTIDLTQVTPTTQATLYFNLLGFGERTSTVTYVLRHRLRQRRRKTLHRHPTHPRHQKRYPHHQSKHPHHRTKHRPHLHRQR
jgi:hypothetical protein